MPLYEYRCQECGNTLEVIQKFSDAPLTQCTDCGGELQRLLSAPSIQFKGSGWYVSDYGRKNGSGHTASGDDAPSSKEKENKADSSAPAKDASAKGKAKDSTSK